ncbi:MAG: outer membrane beta-barrel protein [Flavobacteriaceae bacterium]
MCNKPLIFFLLLFVYTVYGQEFVLSGSVLDENKLPVAYANVIISTYENSRFIQGATSNETGFFKIENLKEGRYKLQISYLGYESIEDSVDLKNSFQLPQPYILKEIPHVLENVNIVAKRPTVKRTVDRLVFNVEQSTLSNENILNVLKHTPSVFVHDGTIKVKAATPTIYINDKKVHLSLHEVQQLLEGTSATNVKAIEVITNPPAQFEAEGGAVINIVTGKNLITGYNGSVFGSYNQGFKHPKYVMGTSHFYKAKRLNTYLNYNINPREDYRQSIEKINFHDKNDITRWNTDYKRNRKSFSHNINANAEYEINSNNTIALTTSILVSPEKNNITKINSKTNILNRNYNLDSLFDTNSKTSLKTANLAFTLDYTHKFEREGEKILLSFHQTNYDNSSFQNVSTGYYLPSSSVPFRDNRFQTHNDQNIELYTGQIDYELPLTDSEEIKVGTKLSSIDSDNDLSQYLYNNGVKVEDLDNTDTFKYNETGLAAYASYAKEWDKWSLKTGLRLEFTNTKSESINKNEETQSDYLKLFPSIYILNRLNDNNEWYFNYNRRIHRPRYAELNPFKYYLNDNTFVVGDPNLKPQIDDVLTLGYTLNNTYTFEVYYRYENNPTLQITFQDNKKNTLQYINTNIDKSISYGLDFTTYTPILNDWSVYALASIFFYENGFSDLKNNHHYYSNEKWSFYSQVINYFSFLKDKSLTADVSLLYISPFYEGPTLASDRFGLDVNLKKDLWKNRASVNIGVTDIFNTLNYTQTTNYLDQDSKMASKFENRLLTFGFNYKFGNYRLKPTEKEIEMEERDRLNYKK